MEHWVVMQWLSDIESLLQTGKLEIQPGIFIKCGKEVNVKIYADGTKTVIDVLPPKLYVEVKQLLKQLVLSVIKPDIDKIVIDGNKMTVVIDNLPDREIVISRI